MSTAIYFPQPIETDDEAGSESPEPPTRRWWPVARRASATALIMAIGAVVAIIAMESKPVARDLPAAVAGTAEVTIRQFLSESGERYIVGTAVVDGQESDDGWTVVVAAELLALTDAGYVADGLHYYEMLISEREDTWQAARAPAEVAGPAMAPLQPVMLESPENSPAVSAIQGYLDWFLTGSEGAYDMARPTPAPYVSATITGLRIVSGPGDTSSASVQVVGLDRFGHALDLSYQLTLVLHRGSWIVASDEAS